MSCDQDSVVHKLQVVSAKCEGDDVMTDPPTSLTHAPTTSPRGGGVDWLMKPHG